MSGERPEGSKRRPRVGITIGDPAGIGPEVSLKAVADDELRNICSPVLIGDASYLARWSSAFGLAPNFEIINAGSPIPR